MNYIDKDGRFDAPIHGDLTREAFKLANLIKLPSDFSVDMVCKGSVDIDSKNLGLADVHFDNCNNFKTILDKWTALENKINASIPGSNVFGMTVGEWDYGALLHTVEDFYAHSNYVPLYIEYYIDKYGTNLTLENIPIFREGIKDFDFLTNYLVPRLYTGEFSLGQIISKWSGGNISNRYHDFMAIDNSSNTYFYGAEDAAIQNVKVILENTIGK